MKAAVARTDAEIQQDVLLELKWDTRVKETEVGVAVDRGIVTLTGTVDSYAKKIAAQEAAHRVKGVLVVANELRVHIRREHLFIRSPHADGQRIRDDMRRG